VARVTVLPQLPVADQAVRVGVTGLAAGTAGHRADQLGRRGRCALVRVRALPRECGWGHRPGRHRAGGEADQTWTSCPYAQAIMHLLNAHHDRWAHVLYACPGAGHQVGSLVPDEPSDLTAVNVSASAFRADQEADGQLWPHLPHLPCQPDGQQRELTTKPSSGLSVMGRVPNVVTRGINSHGTAG
jgi:hypothetical protein